MIASDLENCNILQKLDEGGWGSIFLARQNNKLLVIKALCKANLCQSKWSIQALQNERNILIQLNGIKWFPKLYFSLDKAHYLYLGMEFCQGGNLLNFQNMRGHLSFVEKKFLFAEMLVAIEEMHRRGIIHRDIKRENILLKGNGHIAISDFGLSNNDFQKLRRTCVGTIDHVSRKYSN